MSNIKYEDGYYNEQLKIAFLSQFVDTIRTYETYARILKASRDIEEEKNKDLARFNISEIEDLFDHLSPTTLAASRNNISIVNSYIDWAIVNGHRENNINPISLVKNTHGFEESFIDKTFRQYFSKKEIYDIVDFGVNPQDTVIPLALFEGFAGKENFEIRHLKWEDVDQELNKVLVRNVDGSAREIEVSDMLMRYIKLAYNQKDYYKNNGHELPDSSRNRKETLELLDTGFVLKNANTRVANMDSIGKHVISRRLTSLGEYFGINSFTAIKIIRSGMIYMGYELLKRDGILDKEQLTEICIRFNIPKVQSGNSFDYNFSRLKELVNKDAINDLYSI
ncbi:phage lytic cycle repressor MrpR family protein [Brevibacillus daliensis]|uniref:phage lytic cycle repressor MrpR family protein n=1 Tax=Brevibacillus daliensis TaxID=2892995 RepID=UPI001E61AFAB|nr:hypothetical protein [Brevibacillus daliensis]